MQTQLHGASFYAVAALYNILLRCRNIVVRIALLIVLKLKINSVCHCSFLCRLQQFCNDCCAHGCICVYFVCAEKIHELQLQVNETDVTVFRDLSSNRTIDWLVLVCTSIVLVHNRSACEFRPNAYLLNGFH